MSTITLDTPVEDLVSQYPKAVAYGVEQGVSFVFCVGAYPASLGDLLRLKKVADPERFVQGLNEFLAAGAR
jgi:hypothetical protein